MADATYISINGVTRDINVKNGKITEEKLNQNVKVKLFPHVWVTQDEYDAIQNPVEGTTYIIYEEET